MAVELVQQHPKSILMIGTAATIILIVCIIFALPLGIFFLIRNL